MRALFSLFAILGYPCAPVWASSKIEAVGAATEIVLDQGESTAVSITASKWKEMEEMLANWKTTPRSGDLDVLDGSQATYKIVKDISTSQQDYTHYYMLLWKKPAGTSNTPPYISFKGEIYSYRTNDIGVNSVNQFYISTSHSAQTKASSVALHPARNSVKQLEFVVIPFEGQDYIAMHWDHSAGAGFHRMHLDATFRWMDSTNKEQVVDSNMYKMIYSQRVSSGGSGPLHTATITNEYMDNLLSRVIKEPQGEFDVLDGTRNIYNLVLTRGFSQADYSYFYLFLWKAPLSSNSVYGRPPHMSLTGEIITGRTNDIGVNSVNEFYVSSSHAGYTYGTTHNKHQGSNHNEPMAVVEVTYNGVRYIALVWNHKTGAGFASAHLKGTFYWLNGADKSKAFDGQWLKSYVSTSPLPTTQISTSSDGRIGPV